MTCDDIRSFFSRHMDEPDAEIAAHIETCDACRTQWDKFLRTVEFVREMPAPTPPPHLLDGMLSAVAHAARADIVRQRRGIIRRVALAAAAFVAVAFIWLFGPGIGDLYDSANELAQENLIDSAPPPAAFSMAEPQPASPPATPWGVAESEAPPAPTAPAPPPPAPAQPAYDMAEDAYAGGGLALRSSLEAPDDIYAAETGQADTYQFGTYPDGIYLDAASTAEPPDTQANLEPPPPQDVVVGFGGPLSFRGPATADYDPTYTEAPAPAPQSAPPPRWPMILGFVGIPVLILVSIIAVSIARAVRRSRQ